MLILDKYKNILFDLDGTLTDPKIGITKSVSYALNKFDIIVEDLDTLKKFIGPPLGKSFETFYGMDKEKSEKAIKYYREYFSEKGIFENYLYPGIEKILKELTNRKLLLIIATSKPTVFAKKITNHFNITKYFNYIEGSELDGKMSDKSELIENIINKYNLHKNNTIMIGDREHDIIGAKNNQIDSIGVGYGYGSKEELTKAGAQYYVNSINDLEELLLDNNQEKEV